MNTTRAYSTAYESLLLPRIVRLGPNLYGACFTLMKLIPANHILGQAHKEGLIHDGTVVIETSSGTFGLALAMICNQRGWPITIVGDPVIDDPLRRRLEDLGAVVDIVEHPADRGGFQRSRLDRLAALADEYSYTFCPSQYDNPQNPASYSVVAEHLTSILGRVDCLVGAVGSGGSICGTTRSLRTMLPELTAIGVDTQASVLFGQPDGHRIVRGLGNSLMPPNLDHTVFDEVHWLDAASAFLSTRVLHRRHALFMGGTSGASYAVARWWAENNPDSLTVAFLPDEGHRYQDTIYSDTWLKNNNLWLDSMSADPRLVVHPLDVGEAWTRLSWGQRSYREVMGVSWTETRS